MRAAGLALMALSLAACSGSQGLHDMTVPTGGPDDFSVLPVAALEIPETLALPEPKPGATNRVDPDPIGQAVAALGGRASAATAGGIPAGDAALVAAVSTRGVDPAIRATLAGEDAAFRRRSGTFARFNPFSGGGYFAAYAAERLDAYVALQQFRNLGVATPTAPPAE